MIRVKLLEGPAYWMTHYAESDGSVYLDLSSDFSVSLSKEIEQQSSINKINIESVLGTSIPDTAKNANLIGKAAEVALKDNQYLDIKVQVIKGIKILNQGTLRILSRSSSNNTGKYEAEFLDTSNHWVLELNKIYLDDLPFQKFDYTPFNLYESIALDAKYDDGDNGYWFPLCNYGLFFDNGKFSVSDFRAWVHVKKVFDLAFNKIGWKYDCPLLSTDTGRRLITYVLKSGRDDNKAALDLNKFKVSLNNTFRMPKAASGNSSKYVFRENFFDKIIYDPGNNYEIDPNPLAKGRFKALGYFEFTAELFIDYYWHDTCWGNKEGVIKIQLVHKLNDGNEDIIDEAYWNEEHTEHVKDYKFYVNGNAYIKTNEYVFVRVSFKICNGPNEIDILPKSTFYGVPLDYIANEGDSFDLQKSLRHDKVLDYVKGIDHLFNFKYYTNFAEKKVYILTPYQASFFGDSIDGFFQDTLDDLTSYIDLGNTEVIVPNEDKKNLYYRFKKSTDPSIAKLKLEESKDLHSKFINIGKDFKDETENFENPYFEPTYNGQPIGFISAETISDIPYLLDNDEGNVSFNIGPRIAIAAGLKQHYFAERNPSIFNYFDKSFGPFIPYAYQLGEADTSFTGTGESRIFSKENKYLVYGDKEFDLFNQFYYKHNKEFRDCIKVKNDVYFHEDKYTSIDFRKSTKINHKGTDQYGRLLSVDGYNLDTQKGKIIFKADNTTDPSCQTYTPINQCANYPEITVTATGGGNYTITAGGTHASLIASTVIEWRYSDDVNWTAGSMFNTLDKQVYARVTWTYSDGCPERQKVYVIDPCGNYPKLCFERILPDNVLNVYECGVHAETPIGYLYEWSTNNKDFEEIPTPFILDDIIATDLFLRVTVYYPNCPSKIAEGLFDLTISSLDCSYDGDFLPSVKFVHTLGGLHLERSGSVKGKVAVDLIWFREAGSNDEWDLFDEKNSELLNTDSGKNWEAYRTIIFCNNSCPTYCSDVITAKTNCTGSVTLSNSITPIDHELKWEHPDIPGSNTWKATIDNDSSAVIAELRSWVIQDIGGIETDIAERTVRWNQYNFKTEFSFTWNEGDTIQSFRISKNVSGVQTTGLNANIGVTFSPGALNDILKSNLENAIREEIGAVYGFFDNVDYDLIITIIGSGTSRTTKISFVSKKVITDTWLGPKKAVDTLTIGLSGGGTSAVSCTGAEFQILQTTAPVVQYKTPCGTILKVKLKVSLGTQFIDDAASNFDTIVLNTSIAVVSETLTALTDSCSQFNFTAALTDCTSPTYLWKRGNKILGTAPTQSVHGTAEVDVFVTCNDGCTYMASEE
ncbi:MAG: hypothetical protein HOP11_09000 [Saprospiraceae bacterium]|nr:hypothetical protein [Saprospiraceae bacterium]